jgi:hypothetical protein
MDKARNRLIAGAVITTLSLLLPASVRAYGTADESKATLAKTDVVAKIASNTKNKQSTNGNSNAKGSVELLESLKKARKEKGGGK